jgi:hypothetical protein
VKHVQAQVDEVVQVMHTNMEKVMERGERLDQLQNKTGAHTHTDVHIDSRTHTHARTHTRLRIHKQTDMRAWPL